MRFRTRKHRGPPSVIIVSLIDVLIVVLIFLMVATTFKQQPALKLALPESNRTAEPGDQIDHVVITIAKEEPFFFLGSRPIVFDRLATELKAANEKNPGLSLAIRADREAPFGQIVRVMDAAKEAGIKKVNAFTEKTAEE
jgi:biopolymer transport protein ExbD